MTKATVNRQTATYAYDADGSRVSTTVGQTTNGHVYDRTDGLPTLVADNHGTYTHADGALA